MSSLRFIVFPSAEVLPQNDKAFFLPRVIWWFSKCLRLSDGKREERGAGRDDHILPAVEPVGDCRGIDGRAQLHVPQILVPCAHRGQ